MGDESQFLSGSTHSWVLAVRWGCLVLTVLPNPAGCVRQCPQ